MSTHEVPSDSHEFSNSTSSVSRPELPYDELAALITSATGLHGLITRTIPLNQRPNKKLFAGYGVSVDGRGDAKLKGFSASSLHGDLTISIPDRPAQQGPRGLLSLTFTRVSRNGARKEFGYTVDPDLTQTTTSLRNYVHQSPALHDAEVLGREMQLLVTDILANCTEQPATYPNDPLRWLSGQVVEQTID